MHTFDGTIVKHRWMGLFQTFESVGSGPDAITFISEYQGKELQALFPMKVGDRITLERKTTSLTRESKLLPAPPPVTREKLEIVVSHSEAIAIGPCSYDTLVVAQKSTDLETGQIVETRFNYAPSIRYVIKDTITIQNPGQPPGKPSELAYDGIALK
jgi:hypothetical protein